MPFDTHLKQDVGNEVEYLTHELEKRIVGEVLERKLSLCNVPRIGLSENGVAVSRDNLTSFQRGPRVLLDSFVAGVLSDGALHLPQPDQHFLIRETM